MSSIKEEISKLLTDWPQSVSFDDSLLLLDKSEHQHKIIDDDNIALIVESTYHESPDMVDISDQLEKIICELDVASLNPIKRANSVLSNYIDAFEKMDIFNHLHEFVSLSKSSGTSYPTSPVSTFIRQTLQNTPDAAYDVFVLLLDDYLVTVPPEDILYVRTIFTEVISYQTKILSSNLRGLSQTQIIAVVKCLLFAGEIPLVGRILTRLCLYNPLTILIQQVKVSFEYHSNDSRSLGSLPHPISIESFIIAEPIIVDNKVLPNIDAYNNYKYSSTADLRRYQLDLLMKQQREMVVTV